MPARPGARRTARLRLEPIGPEHAQDLWRRSRAVMERLGMRQVGQLRARGLVEGRAGVHNGVPFSLHVRAGMRGSV